VEIKERSPLKKQIIFSLYVVLLFVLVNLSYLWEENSGAFAFYWGAFLLTSYLFFGFIQFIVLAVILYKRKFELKRLLLNAFNIVLLSVLFFYPKGILKPSEKRAIYLEAAREGAANCTTTLSLFKNKEFKELNICFGVTSAKGTYTILNDTVYFNTTTFPRGSNRYYDFAIIRDIKNSREIVRLYKNDTLEYPLFLIDKK